jgi:hypothetical protein
MFKLYIISSDRLCGLMVRVPGYRTEMYCVSWEVGIEFIYVLQKKVDRPCGLLVRVPGYRSRGPGFDSRRYSARGEVSVRVQRATLLQLVARLRERGSKHPLHPFVFMA